ncbi:AAA family ATPase [Enhygromyxa salina]|uniref:AAA family ATPase n=1 Tax=Enhygromyxa salina TaxID=215803 RepID=UPI000696D622|nr:DUF3696 domain-containing protein [Enhygromyxa salina]
MAKTLRLHNFKCFDALEIALAPMTLLAGVNGSGKSSVIQSILGIAQSNSNGFSVNGEHISLGTARDVLFEGANEEQVTVAIGECEYVFAYGRPEATLLECAPGSADPSHFSGENSLTYLECERVGPRPSFEMSDLWVRRRGKVGPRGQYAVHFLAVHTDTSVREQRHHQNSAGSTLRPQVEAWLGEISPGTRLDVVPYEEMDRVRLSISFVADRWTSRGFRPTNVGFGITYVLPIIIAGLAAPPGSWLIVENPEAHLHPRGQTQMGIFLSRIVSDGVRVLIETHSDHLMNGVRLSVKRQLIQPTDVAMHYFERENDRVRVVSPSVHPSGRLTQWPAGFFDQWETSLTELLRKE